MDLQTFGEELRKARSRQDRTLDDFATQLKIHRRHLEAIEAGDLTRLPQGPYVKAFVREYARALSVPVPEDLAAPAQGPSRLERDPKVVSRPAAPAPRVVVSSKPSPASGASAPTPSRVTSRPFTPPTSRTNPPASKPGSALPGAVKTAVKTVTKTTGTVVNMMETSSKEAIEVLTSKSLWDEAENVRRERLGLPPLPDAAPTPREIQREAQREASRDTSREAGRPDTERDARHARTSASGHAESYDLTSEEEGAPERTTRRGILGLPRRAFDALLERTNSRSMNNIVIGSLAVLFLGAIYLTIRMSHSGAPEANGDYVPAPIEKVTPVEPRRPEPTPAAAAPAPTATPGARDSVRFTLRAIQTVWVSIAPDGVPAFRGEIKAGEVRSFHAAEKILVNLGNQHSVTMELDGQKLSNLPTIPNSGVVVRDLVLMHDRVTLGGKSLEMHQLTGSAPSSQHAVAVVPPSAPSKTATAKPPTRWAPMPATNAPALSNGKPIPGKPSAAKPATSAKPAPNAKPSANAHPSTLQGPRMSSGKPQVAPAGRTPASHIPPSATKPLTKPWLKAGANSAKPTAQPKPATQDKHGRTTKKGAKQTKKPAPAPFELHTVDPIPPR